MYMSTFIGRTCNTRMMKSQFKHLLLKNVKAIVREELTAAVG